MKNGINYLLKLVVNGVYFIFKFLPKKKENVFFSTRQTGLEGNLLVLYETFTANFPNESLVILNKKMPSNSFQLIKHPFFTFKTIYYLATSQSFILDDFCLPLYMLLKKPHAKVYQIWHAAGAFKKFGWSVVEQDSSLSRDYLKIVPLHSHYDKAFVSSKAAVPYFAEAFQMNQKDVLPLGTPKTDWLITNSLQEKENTPHSIFEKYTEKSKLIVYLPTFRNKMLKDKEVLTLPFSIDKMYQMLEQTDAYLLIQLHPYVQSQLEIPYHFQSRIKLNTKHLSTDTLLLISDILISDYSSIIFDYSLLKKPLILYTYDFAEYLGERGFYWDFVNLFPDIVAKDESAFFEVLATEIQANSSQENRNSVAKLADMWFDSQDGHAALRIAQHISAQNKESSLEVRK